MAKIKVIQSVLVRYDTIIFADVLKAANDLKHIVESQIKAEGLENEFEVVVEVLNSRAGISLTA